MHISYMHHFFTIDGIIKPFPTVKRVQRSKFRKKKRRGFIEFLLLHQPASYRATQSTPSKEYNKKEE